MIEENDDGSVILKFRTYVRKLNFGCIDCDVLLIHNIENDAEIAQS